MLNKKIILENNIYLNHGFSSRIITSLLQAEVDGRFQLFLSINEGNSCVNDIGSRSQIGTKLLTNKG